MTDATPLASEQITQEDREAAADMHAHVMVQLEDAAPAKHLCDSMTARMRAGYYDADESVQAFARHRIAALSAPAGVDTVAFVQEWLMSGDHEPTQWDRDFAAAIEARAAGITEALAKRMASRFLAWKLPADFNPDGGVTFKNVFGQSWPVGTNLFTATQAEDMVREMLSDLAAAPAPSGQEVVRSASQCTTQEVELAALLAEVELEMRHCRIFVSTREKMHPTGIELYDQLHAKVNAALEELR